MHYHGSSSPGSQPQEAWVYRVLGDQNFRQQRGFFPWWYRHTSPPDASAGASFAQRDRVRRSRLASALMLFLLLVLCFAAPIGLIGANRAILAVTTTVFVAIVVSIPFNRRGMVEIVGLVMTVGMTAGMYTSILATPGGMSPADKDILYLLFFSDLMVAALLPVHTVFLFAALNIAFSIYALLFAPHAPALTALLAHGGATIILSRLVQIHLIVAGVMWILVNNLKAASQRADRAEEIARLQHDLAQITRAQAQEKEDLERQMASIAQVHVQVAKGDLTARVPLMSGQTLWTLAVPLNTLLGRYQQARQAEERMQHLAQCIEQAQHQWQQEIAQAMEHQRPLRLPPDPLLAPLIQELNGKTLVQPLFHRVSSR